MIRLLIVEDSVASSVMMEAMVHRRKPDCEVRCCLSMASAIVCLGEFHPNIVILDLDLPDSGPENSVGLIPVFKKHGACVIAITGHDGFERAARKMGADDFIEKAIGQSTTSFVDHINRLIPACSDPS